MPDLQREFSFIVTRSFRFITPVYARVNKEPLSDVFSYYQAVRIEDDLYELQMVRMNERHGTRVESNEQPWLVSRDKAIETLEILEAFLENASCYKKEGLVNTDAIYYKDARFSQKHVLK